jgi:hypothetical protein
VICCFPQRVLPLFKALAEVTKVMEGENCVLSSSYWLALRRIENVLEPVPGESADVAAVRAAMRHDHFNNRITLAKSLQDPLHCLMHFLDHR